MTTPDKTPPSDYPDKCVCCGTPVRVEGNVTKSYVSAYDSLAKECQRLRLGNPIQYVEIIGGANKRKLSELAGLGKELARKVKALDGIAAVNLAEPSPGDLERVTNAYRELLARYNFAIERVEQVEKELQKLKSDSTTKEIM